MFRLLRFGRVSTGTPQIWKFRLKKSTSTADRSDRWKRDRKVERYERLPIDLSATFCLYACHVHAVYELRIISTILLTLVTTDKGVPRIYVFPRSSPRYVPLPESPNWLRIVPYERASCRGCYCSRSLCNEIEFFLCSSFEQVLNCYLVARASDKAVTAKQCIFQNRLRSIASFGEV